MGSIEHPLMLIGIAHNQLPYAYKLLHVCAHAIIRQSLFLPLYEPSYLMRQLHFLNKRNSSVSSGVGVRANYEDI